MLLSKKSLYAIRALLEIMANYEKESINSAEIAKRQGVSGRFIEIILNDLKRAGIVKSKRGSNGGYFLSKAPDDLNVLDVIEFIDGPIELINKTKEETAYFGITALNNLWTQLSENIVSNLKSKTLKDLFQEENLARNKFIYNYAI